MRIPAFFSTVIDMQKIYYRTIRSEKVEDLNTAKRGSWLHITQPTKSELEDLSEKYGFNIDLLKDGVDLYEAPRLEQEESGLYIYLRYCKPESLETSTEPMLIILSDSMVTTIARNMPESIEDLISRGQIVTTQKIKLVLEILYQINRDYRIHLNKISKFIFSSRMKLQKTIVSNDDVLRFIDLEEDLNEFLTALQPYGILLHGLMSGRYFALHEEDRDLIEDIQLSTSELIELTKSRLKTLQNMREAYSTIATNNLNRIFKRLTSIAIFMAIPTIVGGLYGMNVSLPFDQHPQAFWIITGTTTTVIMLTVLIFNKKRWL